MRASPRDGWTEWAKHHDTVSGAELPKRQKYGAIKIHVDGYRFDSKREAARYHELKLMLGAGLIADLEVHPQFPLMVPELFQEGPLTIHTIGRYTADFKYTDGRTGLVVVEDVKSKPTRTEAYQLRKKIVEANHGITIMEIE